VRRLSIFFCKKEVSGKPKNLRTMTAITNDNKNLYDEILRELICFSGKHGLYIIRPKTQEVLKTICQKLGFEYKSDIAYIGKGARQKE
jgi:hypothetical protein